jgi:hypothetical protein
MKSLTKELVSPLTAILIFPPLFYKGIFGNALKNFYPTLAYYWFLIKSNKPKLQDSYIARYFD